MDLETVIMSEVSQAQNEKYHMMYDTNELVHQRATDSQTLNMKFWLPGGKGGGKEQLGSLRST